MIRIVGPHGLMLEEASLADAIWIDLIDPGSEEEQETEALFGFDIPTLTEREALEESSRYYAVDDVLFITTNLLGRRDEGNLVSGPVTFVLSGRRLVTIRSIHPRAFDIGKGRASARISAAGNGSDVLLALMEGAIERLADLLVEQSAQSDAIANELFTREDQPNLRSTLKRLGLIGSIAALGHGSLSSLLRTTAYLIAQTENTSLDERRLKIFRTDIAELEHQAEALQTRIAYLQDAALGLINSKQTDVLKALSLATIAFVPATLVSSIFGMNFQSMHWYAASWGAPAAFALMIVAPLALFAIARWRKWF